MTLYRVSAIPCLLLGLCGLTSSRASAQTAPWTASLRGSWLQTGPAAAGDVTLAGAGGACQIVVSDDENAAVRQAAEFLAGDIEKISGYRPLVAKTPSGDRVNIRLVTLGHGELPAAIDARAMQGQWESYRIAAASRDVWLVGSNPRGTAFAAYALSERLGIDPLYIWTGYWTGYAPVHRDPLVMKRTSFAQNPPAFRYRGFFHDDEDLLPRPFDATGHPLQTGDVPQAALKLEEALRAPDAARMWLLAGEAQTSLERLETEFARAEYPPFDRWYAESWIRSANSQNNPHRPYVQLRAFIASE